MDHIHKQKEQKMLTNMHPRYKTKDSPQKENLGCGSGEGFFPHTRRM